MSNMKLLYRYCVLYHATPRFFSSCGHTQLAILSVCVFLPSFFNLGLRLVYYKNLRRIDISTLPGMTTKRHECDYQLFLTKRSYVCIHDGGFCIYIFMIIIQRAPTSAVGVNLVRKLLIHRRVFIVLYTSPPDTSLDSCPLR